MDVAGLDYREERDNFLARKARNAMNCENTLQKKIKE